MTSSPARAAPTAGARRPSPLPRSFFARPAEIVARALLGKRLVYADRSAFIVETEAYVGPHDLASHSRFGVTDRNRVMWGDAGVTYVYLIYGMYDMFNVVTGKRGEGQAVLVRGVEPERGIDGGPAITAGPGKLTRALGISRDHSGIDLTEGPPLTLTRGRRVAASEVEVGPRVGIAYAGEWARAPLRFWIEGNPSVSRRR